MNVNYIELKKNWFEIVRKLFSSKLHKEFELILENMLLDEQVNTITDWQ